MAKMNFTDYGQASSAAFMGDFGNREHILAGGAQLDTTATYTMDSEDSTIIPAGTLVGRTIAERDAGDPFGPAADADGEIYIMVHDVDVDDKNSDNLVDIDLVRHGSLIKVNFLPSYAGASAAVKTALEEAYELVRG